MTQRMTDDQVFQALHDAGAILDGHFQLTSGRHSDTYVQCARVLEDPELTTRLAREMVDRLKDVEVDLVAAPAVGGIIIGFAVAQALGVRFIFSERKDGDDAVPSLVRCPGRGQRVWSSKTWSRRVVSVAEVIELVESAGGEVAAVVSLIDRGGSKAFDVELRPLLRLEVESWEPDSCRLCADSKPLTSPVAAACPSSALASSQVRGNIIPSMLLSCRGGCAYNHVA